MRNKDTVLLEQAYQKVLKENFPTPITTDLNNISVYDFIKSLENGQALDKGSPEHSVLLSVMGAIQKAKNSHSSDKSNKRMVEMLPERPGDEPIYQK